MILRQGQVTSGNTTVSGMTKFSDLAVGMFVYGVGIPICTTIASIDETLKTIVLSKAPTSGTGVFVVLQFTPVNPGVYVERCEGLKDVKSIIDERGDYVKVTLRYEDDVSRDAYRSVEKRSRTHEIMMKAYPIEIRPSEKQLEKAGLRERTDITVWTATLDWMNAGVSFDEIEFATRTTVTWQGNVYEIKDKGLVSMMSDVFLYTTLGLVKR